MTHCDCGEVADVYEESVGRYLCQECADELNDNIPDLYERLVQESQVSDQR